MMSWYPLRIENVDGFARRRIDRPSDWVPGGACLDAQALPTLEVVLSGQPAITQASLAPWVLLSRLHLPLTLAAPDTPQTRRALMRVGADAMPADVVFTLRDGASVLATARAAPGAPRATFDLQLTRAATLGLLAAIGATPAGRPPSAPGGAGGAAFSGLTITAQVRDDDPPPLREVALGTLLSADIAADAVAFTVADGGIVHPLLKAWRDTPATVPRSISGPRPAVVVNARGSMTPVLHLVEDPSRKPGAAAMANGGAVGGRIALSTLQSTYVGNDLVIQPANAVVAVRHLPLVDDATAAVWPDCSGDGSQWYPQAYSLVAPHPADPPQEAAFSFVVVPGAPVGGTGGITVGLTATLVFTLRIVMTQAVRDALASLGNPGSQPVSRNGESVVLELTHRNSGATTLSVERFQASIVASGDTLRCSVVVLDEWARLVYSAISGQDESGTLSVRAIASYAFLAGNLIEDGELNVVGGNKRFGYESVATRADIPRGDPLPVLVRAERTLVSPQAELAFPAELPGARLERAMPASPRPALALGAAVRPGHLASEEAARLQLHDPNPAPPPRPPRLVTRTIVRQETVPIVLPCTDYGALYLQARADGSMQAIGCQSALTLGSTTAHPFDELVDLRHPDYRVWRSLQQPGRFMLQPTAFRVGRYAGNHPTDPYRTIMMLYGTISSAPSETRYTLTASLLADVTAAQMLLLRQRLAAFSPAGVTPQVCMPTDPSVGATVTTTWPAPVNALPPQTVPILDSLNPTFTLDTADTALLMAMINQNGLIGAVAFTLSDGTRLDCAMALDGMTTGPVDTGPVTVQVAGARATLVNCTSQTMHVASLALMLGDGSVTAVPADVTLAAQGTATLDTPASAVAALADARPAQRATLDELDIFVEDVTQIVQFVDQVNFGNHGIVALSVSARLQGSTIVRSGALAEGAVLGLEFTLPVTSYLAAQTLEVAYTVTDAAGTRTTPWRSHALQTGAVLGVTADQL